MKTISFWRCRNCKSKNSDLKNKAKDGLIKRPECGKINKVVFESNIKGVVTKPKHLNIIIIMLIIITIMIIK